MGIQVQSATKNGQGESLSVLKRQFISFSYGYKKNENGEDIPVRIEDFDLLAVFSNDRLDKEVYASFEDTTTEQTEMDGQLFWRSKLKAGQLTFNLATDGMTSAQLEEFKNWFQPGIERELILTEHSSRAIKARVSSAPQISLLPFEHEVKVKITETQEVLTKTSLYKGDITLSFVMDNPYWYSKHSCFKTSDAITKERAKVIYEDGIPYQNMFKIPCFLANNTYCSIVDNSPSIGNQGGLTLKNSDQNNTYLYYCGTASVKPTISFYVPLGWNGNKKKITFDNGADGEDFPLIRL